MRYNAIIVASSALYEETKKICKNEEKIYMIPHGVDLQRFHPLIDGSQLKKKFGAEDKIMIFTARNHEPVYVLTTYSMLPALYFNKEEM